MRRLLIIDNYDSFTWNLAHAAAEITGEMPVVIRNDERSWSEIAAGNFDAIIISPGPGHPANARDFGVSADVIRHATAPVLGVCLGHQGIALAYGGEVRNAEPAHGMTCEVAHDGDILFTGVPRRFNAVRYHSLTIAEPLPAELRKIAWSEDGAVMALRHISRPLWGVQFHPESILAEYGKTILRNFLSPAEQSDPAAFYRREFGDAPYAFWLERGGYSLMGRAQEVVSYRAADRRLKITRGESSEERTQTIFDYLDESLRANRGGNGGYVGYFGYELRADCGSPVSHPSPYPDAMLMRVEGPLRIAHAPEPPSVGAFARSSVAPRPRMDRDEYRDRIRKCLDFLYEGEAYELCLTNQIEMKTTLSGLKYYEALRRINPAPYAAYLRLGDLEVACSSPECFLKLDAAGRVESKPIKGTLPRGRTPEEDAALRDLLLQDTRYRAENLMITDLIRNDLGRVATAGSVRVPRLMQVESYTTVHQLVTTVEAQLRPGATIVDCLRAAFPGGSMTGAPRLRAMEILDRLEPGPRGIYSGSIGYIGFDGTADLNIVIRSAVFQNGRASIGTGGAIVAQSDPAAEWDETQLKTAALLRAFDLANGVP